ncbi:Ligand-gated ion channel 50 [Toxocara canis]|uniref:Ligand-gated ion channel 50 n=1 Tax=Toxocara canis TaxID=6265 RepID=A0A0B2V8Z6_TOXCA|nr:Ligand-gated ion channel 50 [Toxocara canis]
MDLYVNEIWHDSKLAFGHLSPCKGNLTLNEAVLSRLWTPNSCFVNSKIADIHDSPSRNIYLTLFSNGTVWVNYRVRVKGPCSMDLSNFPMDTQTCLLIYESFNYNNQEVRMRWNADRPDPVYMLRPINLPDFDIQKIDPILVRVVYPAGMWDELQVRFTFKRRCVWYFLQSYVPTYLTIFISFNYNNQEVRMRWNADRPDPVYMLRPINLPDFDIQKIDPILVRVVYPAGMWDELQVRFTFKRRCVWYFLQSYVPTYLTIIISWIAFSLGPSPKAVQARTMLGVNALLAIIMQFGSTLRKLPRVSCLATWFDDVHLLESGGVGDRWIEDERRWQSDFINRLLLPEDERSCAHSSPH